MNGHGALRSVARRVRRHVKPPRARILQPSGGVTGNASRGTLVVAVGSSYDQDLPIAHTVIRQAYCNAFADLGYAWRIVAIADLPRVLPDLHGPFVMLNGSDLDGMSDGVTAALRRVPHATWVDPWFQDSDRFFVSHGFDPAIWHWSDEHRQRVLSTEPRCVFTATVEGGRHFFDNWAARGASVLSLPLAWDPHAYPATSPRHDEFNEVDVAFVGGWWATKGRQLERYLRPLEDRLTVYGYSEWPFAGYRGRLDAAAEPALYRQARVSPSVNEPSVALLHGQINERVFKVFGSGGASVVDAVPAYRELFTADELTIPDGPEEFRELVLTMVDDASLRDRVAERGHQAVKERHTYGHRANTLLEALGLASQPPS